jgi:hypothetical protein
VTTMLAPLNGQQTDTTDDKYAAVLNTITELQQCEARAKTLRDRRDQQLRDLHQSGSGESVAELRRRTTLSKSMLRLIVGPPRWTPTND